MQLNLPVPARALAIAAHPDDVEFGCGATLAKWAAAGCVVNHLVCTDGSKGSWDPATDVACARRNAQDEQRAAAKALGATGEVVFLGAVDGELESTLDAATRSRRVDPPLPARRRARSRPVAPLPAAPRPPPCRLPHRRRRRGRARSALLSRPRRRALAADDAAAVRGRRRRPLRRRVRLRRREARRAVRAREPAALDDAHRGRQRRTRTHSATASGGASSTAWPCSDARPASPTPKGFKRIDDL